MNKTTTSKRWQFWIDRGGTFTDVVARCPDGPWITRKFLSDHPSHYEDATVHAIREILQTPIDEPLPWDHIEVIKMGTTVATNALLERRGEPTVLAITQGFGEALEIGYQDRPRIFDLHIVRPSPLYCQVIEIRGRLSSRGKELEALDLEDAQQQLQAAYTSGIRSCAIVLIHGYCYPQHEQRLAALAQAIGFRQISVSHQVSPTQKLISRGETTVVDAYLTPVLDRYRNRLQSSLASIPLFFMQSNGGLTPAAKFRGKDSILSGPAGGIIGAVKASTLAGFDRIIAFDMGGTSTDVSLYNGCYERCLETKIAELRMRVPMMKIHTIAAGGGSICHYDAGKYRVGPDSAGANPGPTCYRRGGPLTISDCNVLLGRLQPAFFPQVFGDTFDQSLDAKLVREKFTDFAHEIQLDSGITQTPDEVAEGFLRIAVENMARAIKTVSMQRGHHVADFGLCCFGGAGAQHVCQVADVLGIQRILIPPYAGVLSAVGIGLADLRLFRSCFVGKQLDASLYGQLENRFEDLAQDGIEEMQAQLAYSPSSSNTVQAGPRSTVLSDKLNDDFNNVSNDDPSPARERLPPRINIQRRIHLHYADSDSTLELEFCDLEQLKANFRHLHRLLYGFSFPDKALHVASLTVEIIGTQETNLQFPSRRDPSSSLSPIAHIKMYAEGSWHETPVYAGQTLQPKDQIDGPAMIEEELTTVIVEPGWQATIDLYGQLMLTRQTPLRSPQLLSADHADPMLLELFNNLFMSIAEQMGSTLASTAHSVNIKERLDFSCALFDCFGNLIANAPHMPVHLGSMGDSVKSVIRAYQGPEMSPGDVFCLNAPYNGGTHLPDLTVVTPFFDTRAAPTADEHPALFFLASRGHHADIGGISPGSMPPDSRTIVEEGVILDNLKIVDRGQFQEQKIRHELESSRYPARNPQQNIADLQAQIAANETGVRELQKLIDRFSLEFVKAYMRHVQDYAETCVRRAISRLNDGTFELPMDDGCKIVVSIAIDREKQQAVIDFSGTSDQHPRNFNAPQAICYAAVLYVFRTLIDEDIPLNAGCLRPLQIMIPKKSLLDPQYPAAVVAGNVETSQVLCDALFGALGVLAASQGTMNNFSFGNEHFQYYETVAGGAGAGPHFHGCSAVQTHMTNSRLTDPEVLEWRYPVIVKQFAIRHGSGGEGRYRGGDGLVRKIEFTETMQAAILANRRTVAPFGIQGGGEGKCGRTWVERHNGGVEALSSCEQVHMFPGDVFSIETPGGGGFGAPT